MGNVQCNITCHGAVLRVERKFESMWHRQRCVHPLTLRHFYSDPCPNSRFGSACTPPPNFRARHDPLALSPDEPCTKCSSFLSLGGIRSGVPLQDTTGTSSHHPLTCPSSCPWTSLLGLPCPYHICLNAPGCLRRDTDACRMGTPSLPTSVVPQCRGAEPGTPAPHQCGCHRHVFTCH